MTLSAGHHSIRYPGHDYSGSGHYFITLCAAGRRLIFGRVEDGRMFNSIAGDIVREEWLRTPEIHREISLDEFAVMPNHFHAIVRIRKPDGPASAPPDAFVRQGAHGRAPLRRGARTLGSLIAGFKAAATGRINRERCAPGEAVWQRNYYERIIRGEQELMDTRNYIRLNPHHWNDDEYFA